MVAKVHAKRNGRPTPGKLLDLDALAVEPHRVKIGGKEFELRANSIETSSAYDDLVKRASEHVAAGRNQEASEMHLQLLEFLIPGAPREELRKLPQAKQTALVTFWASEGRQNATEEMEDAQAVVEDPISPG